MVMEAAGSKVHTKGQRLGSFLYSSSSHLQCSPIAFNDSMKQRNVLLQRPEWRYYTELLGSKVHSGKHQLACLLFLCTRLLILSCFVHLLFARCTNQCCMRILAHSSNGKARDGDNLLLWLDAGCRGLMPQQVVKGDHGFTVESQCCGLSRVHSMWIARLRLLCFIAWAQ